MEQQTYSNYELDNNYPPDVILQQLGFAGRTAISPPEHSPFSYMFGTSHWYLCRTYYSHPATSSSLASFSNFRSRLLPSRETISFILDSIKSPELFIPDGVLPLPRYEAVLKDAMRGTDASEQTLVTKCSEVFGVHVVLFIHRETTVERILGIVDCEAPIVYLEQYGTTVSMLITREEQENCRIMKPEDVRSKFSALSPTSDSTVPPSPPRSPLRNPPPSPPRTHSRSPPPNPPRSHSRSPPPLPNAPQLQQFISIQSAILQALLPALDSSTYRFAKETIELVRKGQRLAGQLQISPSDIEPFARLETALKSHRARERIDHEWEHCEFHSENLVQLKCGHRLCKEHAEMLKERCPWRCQT